MFYNNRFHQAIRENVDLEKEYDIKTFTDISEALGQKPDVAFICNITTYLSMNRYDISDNIFIQIFFCLKNSRIISVLKSQKSLDFFLIYNFY